jgi:hypothetical protein
MKPVSKLSMLQKKKSKTITILNSIISHNENIKNIEPFSQTTTSTEDINESVPEVDDVYKSTEKIEQTNDMAPKKNHSKSQI